MPVYLYKLLVKLGQILNTTIFRHWMLQFLPNSYSVAIPFVREIYLIPCLSHLYTIAIHLRFIRVTVSS